ncbi:hypothetical protein AXF42_Ash011680 [Apostasia shenzhenica]|uniref:Myb/SANT-like DNA-binding domain-containing protein n=1 Tax=Apostasia shenzhenica TaxID=1088818 RepID=A0A2H9ZUP3_9ASPA|nr:hypothetical protein AXF42_Ash011680 [Apostasia shenzhenica]
MIPGASYGVLDLQGSMHIHHFQNPNSSFHHHHQHGDSLVHPPMHDVFPQKINHMVDCEKKGDHCKNSTSDDEDEPSFNNDDGVSNQSEAGKGKKGSPWQRMKWKDEMVRLLITAVSYLGDDECKSSGKRKVSMIQKKGKWKLISKVLAEKGCYVSPQQCEDKFNDLNKRYKRLTDILGRGTSCKVVENPALLDLMDHIPDKAKEDVRKILSSKHLFYEEMCSYHNGNRLNLPANPALQRSLQLALRSKDDHDMKRSALEDIEEDDQGDTDDGFNDGEDNNMLYADIGRSCVTKRMKIGLGCEEIGFSNPSHSMVMAQEHSEGPKASWVQIQLMRSHSIQVEEQMLHIQSQMLELGKQRFKWQRFRKKKDRELDKMKMENERMKLDNERLALELKRKQLELGLN